MPKNLKKLLKPILNKSELEISPTSFDIVGSILIFSDIPKKLEKKEKKIAELILENFKNIDVICKKTRHYSGKFRTPKLKIMAGKRSKETIHKENNIMVKLHIEKVYFSARLAHERDRINKLVKKDESILVMFSGCGVYPINISKNTKAKFIIGIEINPIAHKYALRNLQLNKVSNIALINDDVNHAVPKLNNKFNRILLPLPKSGEDYLDIALKKIKKHGTIHFYDFLHESEFSKSIDKIKIAGARLNKKVKILKTVKCGQYGPGKFRICVDAQVN